MNNLEKVAQFHRSFKMPILDQPQIPSEERIKLRISLIEEEFEEFKQAIKDGDIVGVADALTDLEYVIHGASLEFGLIEKIQDCFDEVHLSNMSKLDENDEPIFREDGKVLKSHSYFKPNLKSIVYSTL